MSRNSSPNPSQHPLPANPAQSRNPSQRNMRPTVETARPSPARVTASPATYSPVVPAASIMQSPNRNGNGKQPAADAQRPVTTSPGPLPTDLRRGNAAWALRGGNGNQTRQPSSGSPFAQRIRSATLTEQRTAPGLTYQALPPPPPPPLGNGPVGSAPPPPPPPANGISRPPGAYPFGRPMTPPAVPVPRTPPSHSPMQTPQPSPAPASGPPIHSGNAPVVNYSRTSSSLRVDNSLHSNERMIVHNHFYTQNHPQGHNGAPPGWTQYVDAGPGAAGGPHGRRHPTSRATSAERDAVGQLSSAPALARGPTTRPAVQNGHIPDAPSVRPTISGTQARRIRELQPSDDFFGAMV